MVSFLLLLIMVNVFHSIPPFLFALFFIPADPQHLVLGFNRQGSGEIVGEEMLVCI